ncbi:hypothetical protein ACFXJ8_33340 [Nonomuraea sp. NPDC059194]|uniref:hypothetical protein n=1 Tax=Nonomuraea sp. NPDC059194 TaxID=3346764 RepID=UPI0036C4BC50
MRVVYQVVAVVAALAVVVAGGLAVALLAGADEGEARPVAAPPAVPASSAPSAAPSVTPSASAAPSASATPQPGSTIAPGYTALEALAADRRVPRLPSRLKMRTLPGKPIATSGTIKDAKAGVSVPRLRGPWKRYGAAPFTSRQVLPKTGAGPRGMLVSCPVPIEAQERPRDTALLAARWTLNHHPKGAVIRWLGSQPAKNGWTLYYQVKYGKRSSVAAVAVREADKDKPAMVFVSIPDTQKKRWADLRRVMSGVRVLG